MKYLRLLPALVLLVLLVTHVSAQTDETQTGASPLPAIVGFSVDVASVSVEAAEAQRVYATLSYATIGVPDDYNIALFSRQVNDWVTLAARMPKAGTYPILVAHPLNFGPPTFRMTIYDPNWRVVDEQVVTIPYTLVGLNGPPTIQTFFAATTSVDINAVARRETQIIVAWEVTNRLPTTNLVFEQVLGEGRAISVEAPRTNLWVPSAGNGPLIPVLPEDGTGIRLRVRLVDLRDNTVYDEAEIIIPTTGTYASPTPLPTMTPTFTPTFTVTPGGDIGIVPLWTPTPSLG